jgi:Flp pilus assembly protein TadB
LPGQPARQATIDLQRQAHRPPSTRPSARAISQAQAIANIVFSICAGVASLLVSALSAAKGAPAVAVVLGLLFVGFMLRAREGYRRQRGP